MVKGLRRTEIGTCDTNGDWIDMRELDHVGTVPFSKDRGVWRGLADLINMESLGGVASMDTYQMRKGRGYEVYVRNA
jgi:hypothetical protein